MPLDISNCNGKPYCHIIISVLLCPAHISHNEDKHGIKFKEGAKKCYKEKTITSPLNEWCNILLNWSELCSEKNYFRFSLKCRYFFNSNLWISNPVFATATTSWTLCQIFIFAEKNLRYLNLRNANSHLSWIQLLESNRLNIKSHITSSKVGFQYK